jgi:DNA-binding transcriptional LysR family regulator
MIFDFRLKVFHTVASKLSFTRASSELFISQPAVTKHINELEHQLNTRLFSRKGSSIALTPSGEVLLTYAEKIFRLYASLENEIAQLSDSTSGSLKIGASTTLAQYVLPKILAQFQKMHPQVSIEFIQGNSEFVQQQVLTEKIDIAIVEGISNHTQIHYQPFVEDKIVLVAKSNRKFLTKGEIKPEQLLQIPLVLREQGSGTLEVIFKALNKANINYKDLNIALKLDNTESIKQYILHADCATFLSIHAISKELRENDLSIIDLKGIEIARTFQFIELHGQNNSLAKLFKRFCISNYNF